MHGSSEREVGPRIGVVVNPNSGGQRNNPGRIARLEALLESEDLLRISPAPAALGGIAGEFRQRGVTTVAICGGDGTASACLGALHDSYAQRIPPLAMLRGGTMNTVANSVGVARAEPEQLLARLIEARRAGRELRCDERCTLAVEGHLGFLFGVGLGCSFLQAYYARGQGSPNAWTAARLTADAVFSALWRGPLARQLFRSRALDIALDGRSWERASYVAVAAGTVDQIGLGFRPLYRARAGERAFHLVAFRGSAPQLVAQLPKLWRGRPLPPAVACEGLATFATISSPTLPLHYYLDGELYTSMQPLTLRLGPTVSVLL